MTLENALFVMDIPERGATKGHIRFDLRSLEPDAVGTTALCATVASAILFERLQAQWTHLVIGLDGSHGSVHALARWEDDGLDLTWTPKPLEPGRMEEIAGRIKDKTFLLGKDAPKNAPMPQAPQGSGAPTARPAAPPSAPPPSSEERAPAGLADGVLTPEEEDYLVKQLLRVP